MYTWEEVCFQVLCLSRCFIGAASIVFLVAVVLVCCFLCAKICLLEMVYYKQ